MFKSAGDRYQSRIHGKLKGYHVFLKRAGESEWERIKNYTDCHFGCEIENLWKYTKYVYRVVGYTSVGAGVASPEMSVWTDEDGRWKYLTLCHQPFNFSCCITSIELLVNWNCNSGGRGGGLKPA